MNARGRLGFGTLMALIVTWCLLPMAAQAQGKYPDRAVRVVIPFPPGGQADIMGRRMGAKLAPLLGQSFVLDNRTGAGGNIGAAEVARAKPDGYTLLLGGSSTHVIVPLTTENRFYDPVKDFVHMTVLALSHQAIVVHPNVAKTLPELIKRAKAAPGQLSYGFGGLGSIQHLSGELFKKQAGGLDIVPIPYRGASQSQVDLMSGQIPIITTGFATALPAHRAGRLRILAVFADTRQSAIAPEIPTATEAGVQGVKSYSFYIISAPAGTPKQITDQLFQAANKIAADEAFQKETADSGLEPIIQSNPERATQFIRDELAKWGPIVKAAGLKAE